jgi:uncharacterized OsmC-like protein
MQPTELNGLNLKKLGEIVEQGTKFPDAVGAQFNNWKARVKWLGGFRSRAYIRDHAFLIDEPGDLAGVDTSPNAVEYVLAALGGCYSVGFTLNATKRGIKIDAMEVALEGRLDNVLTFFGLSDKGHSGYKEIKAKLFVKTSASQALVEEVWKETLATSPVGNTLSRNVTIVPQISVAR